MTIYTTTIYDSDQTKTIYFVRYIVYNYLCYEHVIYV